MTSPLLLDTSVASLLHPRKAEQSLRAVYAPDIAAQPLALSFQTVAELYLWADRNQWGARLRGQLESMIARCTVIPPDAELTRLWARVSDLSARRGRRLEPDDASVVATAVRHALTLVTHDRDMVGLPIPGLSVITHLR